MKTTQNLLSDSFLNFQKGVVDRFPSNFDVVFRGFRRKYQEVCCSPGVACSIGLLIGRGLLFLRIIGIFEYIPKSHFGNFLIFKKRFGSNLDEF